MKTHAALVENKNKQVFSMFNNKSVDALFCLLTFAISLMQ